MRKFCQEQLGLSPRFVNISILLTSVAAFISQWFTAFSRAETDWEGRWHTLFTSSPEREAYIYEMRSAGLDPFDIPPKPTLFSGWHLEGHDYAAMGFIALICLVFVLLLTSPNSPLRLRS